MANEAMTEGVHHVGLTVRDLKRSLTFFTGVLGFKKVGEIPDYPAVFVSDGRVMVTLWQVQEPQVAVNFDRRKNLGLHHLALRVTNGEELEKLHRRLIDADGVTIEFAPEPLNNGPTRHMMVYEPSGLRVEFIAPAN